MRKELSNLKDIRDTFSGIFVRTGTKSGFKGLEYTVLLKDIKDKSGKIVTDHLWFNLTKGFESLNLSEGEVVEFNARVKKYEKGYFGSRGDVYKPTEIDYKLSHPTKIRRVIS